MVVGAPPPPHWATLLLALAATSRKVDFGDVRGLSRMTIEVSRASKMKSPPVSGIASAMPSTLSQQLPRESIAKCANSAGGRFLPVFGASSSFSAPPPLSPHGAVASSLCWPKAVTCSVRKTSVIGSNNNLLLWSNRQQFWIAEHFVST